MTILDLFQEEMKTVGDDHLTILERVLEPIQPGEKVLLAEIPLDMRKIVALAGEYAKRAEEVKFKLRFDPKTSPDEHKLLVKYETKALLLGELWWASIKMASEAWCCTGTVQIRKGWVVVDAPDPSTSTASFVDALRETISNSETLGGTVSSIIERIRAARKAKD